MVKRKKTLRKEAKITILVALICTIFIVAGFIWLAKDNSNQTQQSTNTNNNSIANHLVIKVDAKMKKQERPKIPVGSKVVALTFDDGPGYESTQRILDILAKYDAKATWFCLGSKVDANPDMLKKINAAGHEIANHSYNHPNLVNLPLNEALSNINSASASIKNVIGKSPNYLRPPYGSYNDTIAQNTSMKIALWNVDSWDWKLRNGKSTYQHVMQTMRPNPVILFHDIYNTSADAVELLVPQLVKEGYTFVTYSEMMALTGGK